MRKDDLVRLRHMLDASREAVAFASESSREELVGDRKLALALVKCIEILGEAASKVSAETKEGITGLPWSVMIGMRNRLIHAYFDIDLDILWNTVKQDIPPLINELQNIIKGLKRIVIQRLRSFVFHLLLYKDYHT